MSTHDDHEAETAPITDEVHDTSWSANLEQSRYADDPTLAIRDAVVAIEHTTAGNHVNLVTHADLGHPKTFLYAALAGDRDDVTPPAADIDWEYVEQCGCGGHVTRVFVH